MAGRRVARRAGWRAGWLGPVAALTATGLAASLPVLAEARARAEDRQVHAAAASAAAAEAAFRAGHGTYTTSLLDLGLPEPGTVAAGGVRVVVVRADGGGFCLGAQHDGTGATVFATASGTAGGSGSGCP